MDIKSCNVSSDSKKILEIVSLGDRFREAREAMGLSQQKVADCLCLKLFIVKSIEEGYVDTLKIASTFLYGYIRSYARLVHIDNEEVILSFIHKFNPIVSIDMRIKPTAKVVTLYKKYRNMIKLLTIVFCVSFIFVFLILFVQQSKYFLSKKEYSNIFSIALKNPIIYEKNTKDLLFLDKSLLDRNFDIFSFNENFIDSISSYSSYFLYNKPKMINVAFCDIWKYSLYKNMSFYNNINWVDYVNSIDENILVLNFRSDCWIKVLDARDKILYMGTQYSGNILTLRGEIPYKLVIGAPKSVSIRYKGNIVDLKKFICPHKVARLIIPSK